MFMESRSILLTNDDGVFSPSLIPTIDAILKLSSEIYEHKLKLHVVVPDGERSWISKKISKFDTIIKKENHVLNNGFSVTTLSGTPADCANFGIYKFHPDIVVSGANVGGNVDLGHFLSSGTIGAATEGIIAGISSIALSVPYPPDMHGKVVSDDFIEPLDLFTKFFDIYLKNPPHSHLSINIPIGLTSDKFLPANIDKTTYHALFKEIEGSNQLEFNKINYKYTIENSIPGTDRHAISQGIPCVSPLDTNGNILDREVIIPWLKSQGILHVIKK
jgi:5'/3'-nucleotidase SurE